MGVEKVYITWDEVYGLLDVINEYVENLEDFDKPWYVSGIPRGGSILAVLYSHRFNLPYLHNPQNGDHNLLRGDPSLTSVFDTYSPSNALIR